ncbi:GNAT family N-acetyltransferase [Williamsia sp. CHRR-6]|uniref:GNAT family N-acetyltransferase n=1 Tax=Williamsia sp. CHRR-6 TaxID=2835871 RepID=UPI001BD9915C|nr:GNAT family N-acetyltransferase [Williamsia sp. CHRR-6]MBT0565997.1 N-acetyltransferase [Williamsia sp. CHRR-6]
MAQITHSSNGEQSLRVSHSAARERYEAFLGDELIGYLDYVDEHDQSGGDKHVVITHTVIHDLHAHHGHGAELVRQVLDDMVASQRSVLVLCSYVAEFIDKNPQYAAVQVSSSR